MFYIRHKNNKLAKWNNKKVKEEKTNNFLVWKMENVLLTSVENESQTTNWNSLFGILNVIYCEFERTMNKKIRNKFNRNFKKKLAFVSGKVVSGWKVTGDSEWTLIGKKSPQIPQMFYPVDNTEMTIGKGDIVAARCTMVSRDYN